MSRTPPPPSSSPAGSSSESATSPAEMPPLPYLRLPEHANNDKRRERRLKSTTGNAIGTTVAEEYLTIPEVVAELRVPRSTFFITGASSDADKSTEATQRRRSYSARSG